MYYVQEPLFETKTVMPVKGLSFENKGRDQSVLYPWDRAEEKVNRKQTAAAAKPN